MAQQTNRFKWPSFVMGALFLIIGIVIFSFPLENFYAITWLIGLFSVISGVLEISFRRAGKKMMGIPNGWTIVLGVINIIFGLVVMFNSAESSVFLIYIFAIWFIINNIVAIFTVTPIEKSNKGFHTLSIILNIVGIFAGIVLLFNPLLAAVFISFMIAFMFILFGIFYVIDALAS
ncbi:HdeD family acid-resistance protein [Mammaliicoccus fleurettii]|uniref:HdeD family acid-resistance protein n=1 Tax=Mammaliicoccus fleurettii TaxID=150056 RepID=UPI001AAD8DF6|nr:DUF308 domain-containing protein [Mammaliicoccus fleurettii]MBO3061551.1 DUF308 domain-containing protein [Mammaliicoccus fleurettii]